MPWKKDQNAPWCSRGTRLRERRGKQPAANVSAALPLTLAPLTQHQQEQDLEVGSTPHSIFRAGLGTGNVTQGLVSGLERAGSRREHLGQRPHPTPLGTSVAVLSAISFHLVLALSLPLRLYTFRYLGSM